MEIAKITSKGQVTIPIDIRRRYGLQEGNKVLFIEEGDRVYMVNSTLNALREAQQAFEGAAEEAGLSNEDDVIKMMKEFREERTSKS